MAFDRLLDILRKAQARHPAFAKRIQEAEALSRWETAVGPQIAKHTQPLRVEDSILYVEVDHPIWKSELHHRKRQILDILNLGRPEEAEDPDSVVLRNPKKSTALKPAKDILKDLFFVEPRKR